MLFQLCFRISRSRSEIICSLSSGRYFLWIRVRHNLILLDCKCKWIFFLCMPTVYSTANKSITTTNAAEFSWPFPWPSFPLSYVCMTSQISQTLPHHGRDVLLNLALIVVTAILCEELAWRWGHLWPLLVWPNPMCRARAKRKQCVPTRTNSLRQVAFWQPIASRVVATDKLLSDML